MAVRITLDNFTPATVPADGWIVGYRILGSGSPYTIVGPFVALPIEIDTVDAAGTLYEGYITRDCGALTSTQFFWQTPCDCTNAGVGYVISPSGVQCQKEETTAATITNSGYCYAASTNTVYSSFGSRIYNPGFDDTTLNLNPLTADPFVFADLTLAGQWNNPTSSASIGPLNREAVWIDSDCNGVPNALGFGVQTTISCSYNNGLLVNKTIFVGVAGDNQFKVIVNGNLIVDSGAVGDKQFKLWHIIPITVVPGTNFINVVGTGDGSVNDCIGMVVYDNTAAEIAAATTDLDLTIVFASSAARGTTIDVATCPVGYSLDTSGGSGNYICRRTLFGICNAA